MSRLTCTSYLRTMFPQPIVPSVMLAGTQTPASIPSAADTRKQPWKKNWPPKKGIEGEMAYGFKEGATIVIYGN